MKKLSKLHLRNEQYLTNAEMKHITGGEIYGRCNTDAKYRTECSVDTPCLYIIDGGPYIETKPGKCHFGYIKSSDLSESCHCKYW